MEEVKKIKCYQIIYNGDRGWVTNNPDDFRNEIELFLAEEENLYIDINRLLNYIKELEPGLGVCDHCFAFECFELSELEYQNMDEFPGW